MRHLSDCVNEIYAFHIIRDLDVCSVAVCAAFQHCKRIASVRILIRAGDSSIGDVSEASARALLPIITYYGHFM